MGVGRAFKQAATGVGKLNKEERLWQRKKWRQRIRLPKVLKC